MSSVQKDIIKKVLQCTEYLYKHLTYGVSGTLPKWGFSRD